MTGSVTSSIRGIPALLKSINISPVFPLHRSWNYRTSLSESSIRHGFPCRLSVYTAPCRQSNMIVLYARSFLFPVYPPVKGLGGDDPPSLFQKGFGLFIFHFSRLRAIGNRHVVIATVFFFLVAVPAPCCNRARRILNDDILLHHRRLPRGTRRGQNIGQHRARVLHIRIFHSLEELEAFLFVFYQWVALAISTQIHARAQIFHLFEMIDPEAVHRLQEKAPDTRIEHFSPFNPMTALQLYGVAHSRLPCMRMHGRQADPLKLG